MPNDGITSHLLVQKHTYTRHNNLHLWLWIKYSNVITLMRRTNEYYTINRQRSSTSTQLNGNGKSGPFPPSFLLLLLPSPHLSPSSRSPIPCRCLAHQISIFVFMFGNKKLSGLNSKHHCATSFRYLLPYHHSSQKFVHPYIDICIAFVYKCMDSNNEKATKRANEKKYAVNMKNMSGK